jgi:hypothetical protein
MAGLHERSAYREMRVRELIEEAAYARRRHAVYKAKVFGPRPTSAPRLAELDRIALRTERRLDRARLAAEGE